jgi:high-affinity iron transporter
MNRALFPCFVVILLLALATPIHRNVFSSNSELTEQEDAPSANSTEASQRLIFLLQYLATDYERAVQNGQIVDSFEYDEMQRFAKTAIKIYQTGAIQKQTLNKLQKLEELIATRASLPEIRNLCDETIVTLVKEKDLSVGPQRTLSIDYGKSLFEENCVSCHGLRGAGDGPSADTLNPKPRDFTTPERMNVYTPWQFYQAITFGVEGTAMPSFSEALDPRVRWNLAFYLMTLRQDFQPVAPATPQELTLQDLATKSNTELIALLSSQNSLPHSDSSSLRHLVDYYRQNPPELTVADYLTITETGLKKSLQAYLTGDSAYAAQLIEDAYWNGFEFLEGDLPLQICRGFENAYAGYLSCIEAKGPKKKARELAKVMFEILHHVRQQKGLR